MLQKKIPLAGPSITEKERSYVIDAVENGWYEHYDMHITKLEHTFTERFGVKHAIATYCGTHALHLAVLAAGLGNGDEVICTDQSYIATAFAISYVGAVPVFIDIDPETLCMDAKTIEPAITEKTRAIMVVHFAGFTADMEQIMTIAKKHRLVVIEDACQAIGSTYGGKYAGTIGHAGAYSFQGSKIAVGGEGGLFVTNDDCLYEKARHYGTFCRNDAISYLYSDGLGYNYRISNITAALILAQVERLDELIETKKKIHDWYTALLADQPYIRLLHAPSAGKTNYAYTVGYIEDNCPIQNTALVQALLEENIHIRPGYPSMSSMLDYQRRFDVSASIRYAERGIVFPTAMSLSYEDIVRVCDRLINHIVKLCALEGSGK